MNEQELNSEIERRENLTLTYKEHIANLMEISHLKGQLSERLRINKILDGVIRGHSKEKCPICCTALCRAYLVFDLRSEVNK